MTAFWSPDARRQGCLGNRQKRSASVKSWGFAGNAGSTATPSRTRRVKRAFLDSCSWLVRQRGLVIGRNATVAVLEVDAQAMQIAQSSSAMATASLRVAMLRAFDVVGHALQPITTRCWFERCGLDRRVRGSTHLVHREDFFPPRPDSHPSASTAVAPAAGD